MKRIKLYFFILSQIFFVPVLCSQTPQYSSGVADGNISLSLSGQSRKRQSLYLNSDFAGFVPGNITTIYIKRFTTTAVNIPVFNVRLGTTSSSVFPGSGGSNNSAFFPVSALVYSGSLNIPTGLAGDWIAIPLQVPFFYDGTDNLVVEFILASPGGNFNLYRTTRTAGGAVNTDTTMTVASQNNFPYDLGIDIAVLSNVPPVVSLFSAQNITHNSVDLTGEILYDGGASVTRKGFLWSLSPNPILSNGSSDSVDVFLFAGSQFDTTWNTLAPGSKVYVRAFAQNINGTGYSAVDSFYTLSSPPPSAIQNFDHISLCDEIVISWDSIPGVSGYLVAYTPLLALGGSPQNRTVYTAGNALGNGVVSAVRYGSANVTDTISGLTQGTPYRVAVFPFNYNGVNTETYHYLTSPPAVLYTVVANPPAPPVPSDTLLNVCTGDSVLLQAAAGFGTIQWLSADSIPVDSGAVFSGIPVFNDTLFYVAAVSGTCSSVLVSVTVIHQNRPSAWAGNDTLICAGNPVTIGGPLANGFEAGWTGVYTGYLSTEATPEVFPAVSEMYVLVVTDTSNGCQKSDSVTVTVIDPPFPPLITVAGNTLHSSYFTGIQWYLGDSLLAGETSQDLVPQSEGEYILVFTSPSGCQSSDSVQFFFTSAQTEIQPQVYIYPNPFTEGVMVTGANAMDEIAVITSGGAEIYRSKISSESFWIPLSFLPEGVYICRISGESGVDYIRLVKN